MQTKRKFVRRIYKHYSNGGLYITNNESTYKGKLDVSTISYQSLFEINDHYTRDREEFYASVNVPTGGPRKRFELVQDALEGMPMPGDILFNAATLLSYNIEKYRLDEDKKVIFIDVISPKGVKFALPLKGLFLFK